MKKYAYKFTPLNIVLFCLGILIAVVCVVLNVKRLMDVAAAEITGTYDYISPILAIGIGGAGIVILSSAIFSSCYIIKDDKLVTRWGVIRIEIKISDVTRTTVFRSSKKLVVHYNTSDYTVINIDEALFEDFCDALKSKNDKIFYCLDTENTGEKK